ncbi:MAG: carboxymuconolactone decarboxylase family protein [Bacteroidetes bacterium]|nr:carboxymuconolactone decarboxylase family protein [Fibrella sp.]
MENVEAQYMALFGHVPETVHRRIDLARQAGHPEAIEAVENHRRVLIEENPLPAKYQQLVHFALLIGAGREAPARLHAKGALRAGASVAELFGVCETAAITGGMPAFTMAVDAVYEAVKG